MDVGTTELLILGALLVLVLGIVIGFSGRAQKTHSRDEAYGRNYDHGYDHHFDSSHEYHDDTVKEKLY